MHNCICLWMVEIYHVSFYRELCSGKPMVAVMVADCRCTVVNCKRAFAIYRHKSASTIRHVDGYHWPAVALFRGCDHFLNFKSSSPPLSQNLKSRFILSPASIYAGRRQYMLLIHTYIVADDNMCTTTIYAVTVTAYIVVVHILSSATIYAVIYRTYCRQHILSSCIYCRRWYQCCQHILSPAYIVAGMNMC